MEEAVWETQMQMEDGNKMGPKEAGCWGVDWIKLAQDRDKRRLMKVP